MPAQLRDLLEHEDPSSDPAMARLFPPAYADDPIRNLEYERFAGDDLTAGRLAALDRMEATIDADRLTEDDVLAWLSVCNDLRLVLGTRLDITEETTERDFPPRRSPLGRVRPLRVPDVAGRRDRDRPQREQLVRHGLV